MLKLHLTGDLHRFEAGLAALLPELSLELSPEGIPVEVRSGDCLRSELSAAGGRIEYAEPVQFFRALAHIARCGVGCRAEEHPCFTHNGIMFDASRNAVLTVDAMKYFLRKMAQMGLNLAMLYTEDTYEVEGYPAFGYLRGRYSKSELRELDDYAYALGVEMIPCIQTLGHSERILQWGSMRHLADTNDVLLAGGEDIEAYLRRIMRDASEPFRSNRIHIGMDEATGIGKGRFLELNGYKPASEIMKDHLAMVKRLADELGLSAMLWSDMYFRVISPIGGYCETELEFPQELLDSVPADLALVYWDYYHSDIETYRGMIRQHRKFRSEMIFAGGIWCWSGPAPTYDATLRNTLPALEACREGQVREVFATAWGDDGAECNLLCVLYGLQLFAEYGYTGEYREAEVRERFCATVGADPQAFLDLSGFNAVPDGKGGVLPSFHRLKYLLYEDPLLPLFGDDMGELPLQTHYEALASAYAAYHDAAREPFRLLFDFYAQLAKLVALKCDWRSRAAGAVRRGDRAEAVRLEELAGRMLAQLDRLKSAWAALWFFTNKPYGFEVIDLRLGGLRSRLESARERMAAFAAGTLPTIEELAAPKLSAQEADGGPDRRATWHTIVSPGIV